MFRTCAFRPPTRALRVGFLFVLLLAIGPARLLAATLPPTMLRLTGDTVTEGFANKACAAGDVNGDGHPDVIVAAQKNDAGGTDCGANLNHPEVTVFNVATDQAVVKVAPTRAWIAGSDSSEAVFTIECETGVEPEGLALRFRAPWPNPSHGLVRFGLELARPTVVTVTVLDVVGREVARPIAGERFEAGKVEREWRPDGLAPGVYTVRAAVGELKLTRRLVWLGGK